VTSRWLVWVWIAVAPGCVLQQTFDAEVARNRALDQERTELLRKIAEIEKRVSDLLGDTSQLEASKESLESERVALLEKFEDLRSGTEGLRDELERERLERLAREEQLKSVSNTYQNLMDELEKEVQAGKIEVQRLEGRLQVRALDKILFDSGSADIKAEGKNVLKRVAEQITKIEGQTVRIEGHTDDRPIKTAKFPSNWELSSARATRVVRAFIDYGIEPSKISAVGRAEFAPIDSNDTPEGRSRNRRIEIILIPDAEADGAK
jgi:chemotaxis protein MotB